MELILYTANCTGVRSNCLYPNRVVITDKDGLCAAIKFDHVAAKYKDNYRSNDNFEEASVALSSKKGNALWIEAFSAAYSSLPVKTEVGKYIC